MQPSREVTQVISFFRDLRYLDFGCWVENYGEKFAELIPEDVKRAHVKEWSVVCPELISVTFMDTVSLEKEDGQWKADWMEDEIQSSGSASA